MATFHKGYKDIRVNILSWDGDKLAEHVYNFGHLSHDIYEGIPERYDANDARCKKLIDKIIEGTTLPKFAMMGTQIQFEIKGISRICLAQLTRDHAIFASQGGGVFPLTQDFNIPLSILQYDDVMRKVKKAQSLLEEAYIMLAEREVPALEARYIGLHSQTISLTASYTPSDFVRSCWSRTNSNFCDECNYIYRKMYWEIAKRIEQLPDKNSQALWRWLIRENNCINDTFYQREHLYNSDFTVSEYGAKPLISAINDWRNSCWKMELERMLEQEPWLLTEREQLHIRQWKRCMSLPSSYDSSKPYVLKNAITKMPYYKEHKHD